MAESRGRSTDVDRRQVTRRRRYRPLRWPAPFVALVFLFQAPGLSAAASGSGVTSFYRFTYQAATSSADAARYQLMDVGWGNSANSQASVRKLIASIHQATPQTRILVYKITGASSADTQGINGCAAWNPSLPYGGIPLSWFLRGANGVPLYDSTYGYYELDPGNPQVQQACLADAVSIARQGGYNGIFWDMVSTSLFWAGISSANCSSTSCQSDANWHAAIGSFVTNVSAGLHANGLLSIGNISGGAVNLVNGGPTYWQQFQQDGLDGAQEESFTSGTDHLPVSPTVWKQELANEAWNEANGKYFLGNADVTTNQALNTYGLATLLLAAQGRSSWSTADGNYGAGEYWFPAYDTALRLGQPLGPYTVQPNGLYVRRFQNGAVIVNPATSAITDRVYGTLGAQSGLIEAGAAASGAPTMTPPKTSSRPKKRTPRLSGMTYTGRRTTGVKMFAGETVFFDATARDSNGGHHLTYSWNWGDGTLGCVGLPAWACGGASMGHIYRRPGTYAVALSVGGPAGTTVSGQVPITIHAHPPWTVFTVARALGSSVATTSHRRGAVASTLILPVPARSVVGMITIAGCGDRQACVSAVRRKLLGRVDERNIRPGLLKLLVRATNRPLLRKIRIALRKAHKHTLSATFTINMKLANGKPVRFVQHIKLRF
jgi:hypothetical protein